MKKMIMVLGLVITIIFLSGCQVDYIAENVHHADNPVLPVDKEDEHAPRENELDVTMFIQDISPSGLSFFFENSSDREYIYGADYALYIRRDNGWEPVERIIDMWFVPEIAFSILPNSKTEIRQIDWQWVFGDLSDGEYKIQKRLIFLRSTGGAGNPADFDTYIVRQYFSLPAQQMDNSLDYEGFLKLLEVNGFLFEEGQRTHGGTMFSPLSLMQQVVYVDGERLLIEIYYSNQVMERASALIGITSVGHPDYPYLPTLEISWAPGAYPRWFKRDLLIIHYIGSDSRIVDFLYENLTFFVGFDIETLQ